MSNQTAIKSGSIVNLKSGGPSMTVGVYHGTLGGWHCLWFDNTELKSAHFAPETLEISEA